MKKEIRKIAYSTAFLVGTLFSFSLGENSVKTDIYLQIINSFSWNFQVISWENISIQSWISYTNTGNISVIISSNTSSTYILSWDITPSLISGTQASAYSTTLPLFIYWWEWIHQLYLQFIKWGEILTYSPIYIGIDTTPPTPTSIIYPWPTNTTNWPTIFSRANSNDTGAWVKEYTIIIATDTGFTHSVAIQTTPNNEAYIDTSIFPEGILYRMLISKDEVNNTSASNIWYFCNKKSCISTPSSSAGWWWIIYVPPTISWETKWITLIEETETQIKKEYPQEPAKVNIIAKVFYNEELISAYEYAYSLGITTMPTIYKANLNGNLLRRDMAKMISEYAIKVVWKKPNNSISCEFNDIPDYMIETKYYTKLACKLWLMWWEADGIVKADNFNPDEIVSRAQFATIFSRLLYDWTYNVSAGEHVERYQKHLNILNEKEIMKKIDDPYMKELRGRVMLMMMRADPNISQTSKTIHTSWE